MIAYEIQLRYVIWDRIWDKIQSHTKSVRDELSLRTNLKKRKFFLWNRLLLLTPCDIMKKLWLQTLDDLKLQEVVDLN